MAAGEPLCSTATMRPMLLTLHSPAAGTCSRAQACSFHPPAGFSQPPQFSDASQRHACSSGLKHRVDLHHSSISDGYSRC